MMAFIVNGANGDDPLINSGRLHLIVNYITRKCSNRNSGPPTHVRSDDRQQHHEESSWHGVTMWRKMSR